MSAKRHAYVQVCLCACTQVCTSKEGVAAIGVTQSSSSEGESGIGVTQSGPSEGPRRRICGRGHSRVISASPTVSSIQFSSVVRINLTRRCFPIKT